MKQRVAVTKMHGTRNDFVLLDRRASSAAPSDVVAFARAVCARHTGVGADGLLVIEPSDRAAVRMRIINADGSEAEMCGNGVRCVARYLDETGAGDTLTIETLGGMIETRITMRDPEYLVRVDMGVPRFPEQAFEDGCIVDMGNPHVVLLRDALDDVDLIAFGEAAQLDPHFPEGTNLHVAIAQADGSLRVRHYERGVGLTMACGTGAVACAAVCLRSGIVTSPVTVDVPGGTLVVDWDGIGHAFLTGPAVRVFETVV